MTTTIARPNSDLAVFFTPLGGGTNHSEVSESSPDGDSSYNQSSDDTESDLDMFTFADQSIPSGDTVSSVILTVRARDTGGGPATIFLRANHDALYEDASAQGLTTSYVDLTFDFTGSETWLPGDFDGQVVSIGYRVGGSSSNRERRPTQAFLTIIHAAAAQEVTVSDGLLLADQDVRNADHVLPDSLLLDEARISDRLMQVIDRLLLDEAIQRIQEQIHTDGLLLDDASLIQAIRQVLQAEGLLLDDRRISELDRVLMDGLLVADLVVKGVDKLVSEGLLLVDAVETLVTPAGDGVEVERTVTDGLLLVEAVVREQEATQRDSLFLRDQALRETLKVLLDNLALKERTIKERESTQRDRVPLTDRALREQEHVTRDNLFLKDALIPQVVLDRLFTDNLLLDENTFKVLELTQMDKLLLGEAASRIRDLLVRDGLLVSDAGATAVARAGAAAIVWALIKRVDFLGMTPGFNRSFVGMATGRVDFIGMTTGFIRAPEIS